MKRYFKLTIVLLMVLILPTGCKLNKNSSISYNMFILDRKTLPDQEIRNHFDEVEYQEYKDKNITVEEYNDDEYTGYKLTVDLPIKEDLEKGNICMIDITNKNYESNCFEKKQGFFHDTYNVKISAREANQEFIKQNNLLSFEDIEKQEETKDKNGEDKIMLTLRDGEIKILSREEYLDNIGRSDREYDTNVKISVNLPSKSEKNNATGVNGKTLEWNLSNVEMRDLNYFEFTFKKPNMLRIVLTILAGILILYLIISISYSLITNKKKSK